MTLPSLKVTAKNRFSHSTVTHILQKYLLLNIFFASAIFKQVLTYLSVLSYFWQISETFVVWIWQLNLRLGANILTLWYNFGSLIFLYWSMALNYTQSMPIPIKVSILLPFMFTNYPIERGGLEKEGLNIMFIFCSP